VGIENRDGRVGRYIKKLFCSLKTENPLSLFRAVLKEKDIPWEIKLPTLGNIALFLGCCGITIYLFCADKPIYFICMWIIITGISFYSLISSCRVWNIWDNKLGGYKKPRWLNKWFWVGLSIVTVGLIIAAVCLSLYGKACGKLLIVLISVIITVVVILWIISCDCIRAAKALKNKSVKNAKPIDVNPVLVIIAIIVLFIISYFIFTRSMTWENDDYSKQTSFITLFSILFVCGLYSFCVTMFFYLDYYKKLEKSAQDGFGAEFTNEKIHKVYTTKFMYSPSRAFLLNMMVMIFGSLAAQYIKSLTPIFSKDKDFWINLSNNWLILPLFSICIGAAFIAFAYMLLSFFINIQFSVATMSHIREKDNYIGPYPSATSSLVFIKVSVQ
jgi:hypothetical protein